MKNVHLLPTNKSSRLYIRTDVIPHFYSNFQGNAYNIYITSDEEIKKGYVLQIDSGCIEKVEPNKLYSPNWRMILLTTDQDLIKDGVQAIDDEFLEWFVNNSNCEWIKIKEDKYLFCKHCNTLHSTFGDGINCDVCRRESNTYSKSLGYKIIIPKEEFKIIKEYIDDQDAYGYNVVVKEKPKQELPQLGTKEFNDLASTYFGGKLKQETLEEAAEKLYPKIIQSYGIKETDLNDSERKAFIKGAKWQQERSYSEEEVLTMLAKFDVDQPFVIKKWFEQFKKK